MVLGWFRSRKPRGGAAAAPPTLRERLAAWDPDATTRDDGLALCEALCAELAPGLDGARAVRVDEDLELRGRLGATPVRLRIWVVDPRARLEVKLANHTGPLLLRRDLDQIPTAAGPADDWSEDDLLRVFVARGIFVHGDEHDVARSQATLARLPEAVAAALLDGMERHGLATVEAGDDLLEVELADAVPRMPDPVAQLRGALALAGELAVALGAADGAVRRARPGFEGRVRCAYCATLYVLGDRSHCPNCGAAFKG